MRCRSTLSHGALVEQPGVERGGIDVLRRLALAPLQGIPGFLLLGREVGIGDALALELDRHGHAAGRHQVAVGHSLVQAVGIGWDVELQVEQPVGVAVDFVARRGGQADQHRVEIVKDGAVFLVDGAVRFVDHDQVEVAGAKAPLAAGCLVDQAHHGRVRGHVDTALRQLVFDQV